MAAALGGEGERRRTWTVRLAVATWALGLVSIFSFNLWSEVRVFGQTLFDLIAHVTSDLALPLGGLGFAVFAGWVASRSLSAADFGSPALHRLWLMLVRYVAPAVLALVFVDLLR
jgi:NSS family neurotransmitter:Na+ symporter